GTLELAIFAMVIAVFIGINAGIVSAWFQNSWFDYIAMILALVGVSMPIFCLGLMGQWAVSIELPWLPTTGREMSRDPVTAITHLYLIDTLIDGRFDQFVQVLILLILLGFALETITMSIIAHVTRSKVYELILCVFN